MTPFNVYVNGRLVDTVFYTPGHTAEEVRVSLINHDGYSPAIVVKERLK